MFYNFQKVQGLYKKSLNAYEKNAVGLHLCIGRGYFATELCLEVEKLQSSLRVSC